MIESTIDVSSWTRLNYDQRHPFWWGILGLILVEMVVVAIFLASYFYLWIVNVSEARMGWPPDGTVVPPILYPSLNLLLLLFCGWTMWYGGIVMKRGKTRAFVWLVVLCCLSSCVILWLRWLQFNEFKFGLDENAYASFVWVLTGFHFLHVTSALLGTAVIGWLGYKGYFTEQRMLAVQVDTMYWYFVVWGWPPIYFALYLAPRYL